MRGRSYKGGWAELVTCSAVNQLREMIPGIPGIPGVPGVFGVFGVFDEGVVVAAQLVEERSGADDADVTGRFGGDVTGISFRVGVLLDVFVFDASDAAADGADGAADADARR